MEVRLLKVKEVAERLGVHKSTVYRWIAVGQLACLRIGSTIRVHPADLPHV